MELKQVILDLKSMGFDHLSTHKLYGRWFIGLGVSALNMRQIHNLSVLFSLDNSSWMVGNYSALSKSELYLRTNISVS